MAANVNWGRIQLSHNVKVDMKSFKEMVSIDESKVVIELPTAEGDFVVLTRSSMQVIVGGVLHAFPFGASAKKVGRPPNVAAAKKTGKRMGRPPKVAKTVTAKKTRKVRAKRSASDIAASAAKRWETRRANEAAAFKKITSKKVAKEAKRATTVKTDTPQP